MITLSNDFHNTKTTVRPHDGKLSKRQCQKARNELCGVDGCQCSGYLGTRGHQEQDDGTFFVAQNAYANGAMNIRLLSAEQYRNEPWVS